MKRITDYILNDYNYDCKLYDFFHSYKVDDILISICSLLSMDNHDEHNVTMAFFRDMYIGSDLTSSDKKLYIKYINENRVFEYISSYLYSQNSSVRLSTIHNLGEMLQKENAHLLINAFQYYYIHHDPISSYRALLEIELLAERIVPGLLNSMINHKNELFTWFSLNISRGNFLRKYKKNYVYPIVKEIKSIKKDDNAHNPEVITADNIEIMFSNYVYFNDLYNYKLTDLVKFTDYYLINHKKIFEKMQKIPRSNKEHKLRQALIKNIYKEIYNDIN